MHSTTITDIFMIQVAKQLNLPKSALGVHVIIKRVGDFLDRDHLVRLRIQHRASQPNQKPQINHIFLISHQKTKNKKKSQPNPNNELKS